MKKTEIFFSNLKKLKKAKEKNYFLEIRAKKGPLQNEPAIKWATQKIIFLKFAPKKVRSKMDQQ